MTVAILQKISVYNQLHFFYFFREKKQKKQRRENNLPKSFAPVEKGMSVEAMPKIGLLSARSSGTLSF
jgi:hypothetical protein